MSRLRDRGKAALRRSGLLGPLRSIRQARARRAEESAFGPDLDAYRSRFGELLARRRAELPARGTRTALVVGLHNFVPSAKIEGLFSLALRAEGCEPCGVLRDRSSSQLRRYYELFGIERFFHLEDHFRSGDAALADAALEEFFSEQVTLPRLMAFDYRGAEIGKHALSWVVRTLHAGMIDLASAEVAEPLRETLRTAILTVHQAERLLDEIRPELLIVNERGYTPYGELFDAALERGIDAVQWVGCHRDDALQLKRYTRDNRLQHPSSFGPEAWRRIQEMPFPKAVEDAFLAAHRQRYQTGDWYKRQEIQTGRPILEKREAAERLGLDPGKKTVVVFSHILWDATFFYGTSLFEDYATWLVETLKAAADNPRVNWLVKLHPANVWRRALDGHDDELTELVLIRERIGKLPDHVQLILPDAAINTASLFGLADCCVTVRGTVGMEAPMYGIPVLTGGTGRYAGLGFTIDSRNAEEYLDRLARIETLPRLSEEEIGAARRHAHALFELRPLVLESVELDWTSSDEGSVPGVRPRIGAWSEGVPHDLRGAARWALEERSEDFMGALAVAPSRT